MFAIFLNFRALANSEPIGEFNEFSISDRNESQIERLEEIIKNLTDLVLRLETQLSNVKHKLNRNYEDLGDEINENEKLVGAKSSIKKFDPSWSEKFRFVSGVKLNSYATSVNLLPFKDFEGLSKYFAVGDDKGRVFVFLSSSGDVAVEFNTLSDSPITTMLSYYSVYKNESVLVTGHKNGLVLVNRVWEASIGDDLTSVHMEKKFITIGEGGSSIDILEVHHVGRTRYLISTDTSGKIRVFKENGDLYGSVVTSSKPIAFLKQRLLFLTETGAGSLDLRTMRIKESDCEGLNNSYVINYVFDATERSKAYGFTSDGDLAQVLLLGDATNFKCRVRSKKKFTVHTPISVQAIKGFLLVVNHDKVLVYNISSQNYVRGMSPRFAFSTNIDDIRSIFVKDYFIKGSDIPLLASDKEKLFVLGLGHGYVGVYVSRLANNESEFKTMFWSSPILIFVLFLFGAWQFFSKKKEALTSWGPDDPLNTATPASAQLEGSSRNGEAMELRGGALRNRRYLSPSRYRQGPQDTNPRPPVADPSFRGSSELKFRGSNIETSGFPKRRESMFVSSQGVDDSN